MAQGLRVGKQSLQCHAGGGRRQGHRGYYALPHHLPLLAIVPAEAQQTLGSLSEVEGYFQKWIEALQAVGVPGEQQHGWACLPLLPKARHHASVPHSCRTLLQVYSVQLAAGASVTNGHKRPNWPCSLHHRGGERLKRGAGGG